MSPAPLRTLLVAVAMPVALLSGSSPAPGADPQPATTPEHAAQLTESGFTESGAAARPEPGATAHDTAEPSGAEGSEQAGSEQAQEPRLSWPLRPRPEVTRPFEPPECPYCPGHRGVDLAGPPGSPVYAAADGEVIYADRLADRGVVSIDHGDLRTTYEPVEPAVAAGETVSAGTEVGALVAGHSGCTTPACLHFGVRVGERYLDPLPLLGVGQVRLKPLSDDPG